uniref:Ricin B-type lectin domain-containing protein n=1 Tax=Heterorhabditis bacteriophora TaxID=37862 RepID=A0A1I7X311_HETBA
MHNPSCLPIPWNSIGGNNRKVLNLKSANEMASHQEMVTLNGTNKARIQKKEGYALVHRKSGICTYTHPKDDQSAPEANVVMLTMCQDAFTCM